MAILHHATVFVKTLMLFGRLWLALNSNAQIQSPQMKRKTGSLSLTGLVPTALVTLLLLGFIFIAQFVTINGVGIIRQVTYANSIPVGCPGSSAPAPAGKYPAECANIPAMCPGSTKLGPVANFDIKKCPFDAAGNPTNQAQPITNGKCGDVTVGTPGLQAICGTGTIYELVGAIANYLLGLIGALAVLAIIISGIQYVVSQGNPDAVKKAKSRIVNAVVGLVLLALTAVILNGLGVA